MPHLLFRLVHRPLVLVLALLAAPALWALEPNQIRVLRSDGTPVGAGDGVSAAGYLGGSHRSSGTFLGNGVFQFPAGTPIDNARITRHHLTSPALPLAQDVSLVDFRVDIFASEFQGGGPVNVNHGLGLYLGNSHKANFPAPSATGQYHMDVVPGHVLRASVTKDYLTAFTGSADPALTTEADASLRLVDFCVGLDTEDCQPVRLMGAALYLGNSHKANIAFSNPVGALHHDVVPGHAVRASLTQHYQTVFTQALDPAQEREVDVWHGVPTVRVQVSGPAGGESLQLWRESSFMTNPPLEEPHVYALPLLDGLTDLWVQRGPVVGSPFTVEAGRGLLLDEGFLTITETGGGCAGSGSEVVAVEIQTSDVEVHATGEVELSWATTEESGLAGFRVLRDGQDLDTLLVAAGSAFGADYRLRDRPGAGDHVYTVLRQSRDGEQSALLVLEARVEAAVPTAFALLPAVPNPFNPGTLLTFELPESGHTRLVVHNLAGQ